MPNKSVDIPLQSQGFLTSLPVPPPPKSKDYLKAYTDWTFACVTAIATEFAEIQLKLYKRKTIRGKDEIEQVFQHESLAILRNVNEFMTFYNLAEVNETYLQLLGEAYWAKLRFDNGKVAELWPLRPDWVKVIPSKESFIESYAYCPNNNPKDAVIFPKEDIVPFKDLDPTNAYRGMGVVKAAAQSIDIDEFSKDYIRAFFYNSAMPGLVFSTDKKLKEAEIKRFLRQWDSKFRGRKNSHKVAFVGGGLKPTPITNTPAEMQFLENQKYTRDEILALFKVPKPVLGITEDVNLANAEATVRQFKTGVISPRMAKFTAYLNEFYLTEWADEDLFFDYLDPAPEDRELDLKIYASGLQHGWLTPNEVREMENREPVEGGDELPQPNKAPVSSEEKPKLFRKKKVVPVPKIKISKEQIKFNMQVPHRTLRQLRKDEFTSGVSHDLKKLVTLMTVQTQKDEMSKLSKETFWKQMIAKTDVLEQTMNELLIKTFKEQETEVLSNLNIIKYYRKDYRKGKETEILFDITDESRKWQSIYEPFVKGILIEKGSEIMDFLGVKAVFNTSTDESVAFLKTQGLEFVKSVNEVTKDKLKDTLAEGLELGEGVDDLAVRINDVYEAATVSRAKTIARTEVLRATNFATNEAFKQSEVVAGKEWLTALDERVHPGCMNLDGTIVRLEGTFNTEVGPLESPPMHPNCRCTMIPVLKQDGKASGIPLSKRKNKFDQDVEKVWIRLQKKQAKKISKDVESSKTQLKRVKKQSQDILFEARKEASEIKSKAYKEAKETEQKVAGSLEKIRNKLKLKLGG